ncbi:hypothetical protein J6590_024860 [Homalodisca vitripennis]|nr:hypothetical protein J6590_024860 [Homalodisca vitripennis]
MDEYDIAPSLSVSSATDTGRVTIHKDLTSRHLELYRRVVGQYSVRNTWTRDSRVLWVNGTGGKGFGYSAVRSTGNKSVHLQ